MSGYPDELVDKVRDLTVVYRKGPEVTERDVGGMRVTEVFGYDPVPGSPQGGETLVDMVFVTVGVKDEAVEWTQRVIGWLADWHSPTLEGGPSYVHTGGELGDQETALRLFALLSVLRLGSIAHYGLLDREASEEMVLEMAGNGMLYFMPNEKLLAALH